MRELLNTIDCRPRFSSFSHDTVCQNICWAFKVSKGNVQVCSPIFTIGANISRSACANMSCDVDMILHRDALSARRAPAQRTARWNKTARADSVLWTDANRPTVRRAHAQRAVRTRAAILRRVARRSRPRRQTAAEEFIGVDVFHALTTVIASQAARRRTLGGLKWNEKACNHLVDWQKEKRDR